MFRQLKEKHVFMPSEIKILRVDKVFLNENDKIFPIWIFNDLYMRDDRFCLGGQMIPCSSEYADFEGGVKIFSDKIGMEYMICDHTQKELT